MALTGFILSLLLCIPLLTSLGAILFSIIGLRRTRGGMARGRGFAIAGLVIGTIGIVGWIAVGGFALMIVRGSEAPRAALHDFVGKVAAGDTKAAAALCDPAAISAEALDGLHADLVKFGAYSDLTSYSVNLSSGTAGTQCTLIGVISFSTGQRPFNAVLRKDAAGAWKVAGFHVGTSP